jgi:hypothetical protein
MKLTEMLQVSFGAKVLGDRGQFEVWAKSPEVEIPPIVRGTVWSFCSFITLGALDPPRVWIPNESNGSDSAAGITPVPVNCVIWGEFEASLVTVRAPVRDPTKLGVKVSEIEQVSFPAKAFGA